VEVDVSTLSGDFATFETLYQFARPFNFSFWITSIPG
jgi:hypothetical protein